MKKLTNRFVILILLSTFLSGCYSVSVANKDLAYQFYLFLDNGNITELKNFVNKASEKEKNTMFKDLHNPSGLSAVSLAIEEDHEDLISFLVDAGADVNQKNLNGSNALHIASELNKPKVVSDLINNYKIEFISDLKNRTPIHYAAEKENNKTLPLLLKFYSKDINQKDIDGNTALFEAVKIINLYNVKTLLKSKANPNLKNNTNKSPKTYSITMNYDSITRALYRRY